MASLSYFPLYPKDFLGVTGRLTAEKFGIYTRLLFASWLEPLENDLKELTILTGSTKKKTLEILTKFFVLNDGVWTNQKLEEVRCKAVKKHKVAVDRATKAANARWDAPSNAPSNAQAMPTHNPNTLSKDKSSIHDLVSNSIKDSGIVFTSMSVPNMLNVLFDKQGIDAVKSLLEILETKTHQQQNAPNYVRTIINGNDFSKPKTAKKVKTADIYRELPDD
jgi:uncharacterized protein YdaU (DUF1376 family)